MLNRALKLTREFHRMKQSELAKKLGISNSYLSEIESGKKNVAVDLLEAYSSTFNIPASTFLIFVEQSKGKVDPKRKERADKLLRFFEWVLSDDEKEEDTPGASEKAVRA
jgi:transcriptional regulator with XRE-family HTH domain